MCVSDPVQLRGPGQLLSGPGAGVVCGADEALEVPGARTRAGLPSSGQPVMEAAGQTV